MNNNKFYTYYFSGSMSLVDLKSESLNVDDYTKLARGELSSYSLPIVFKQRGGKNWKDILCPSVGLYIISDKVKNTLDENEITGYQTFPITIYGKKGNEVPGYYGLSITGRCDATDWSKSEIIRKKLFEFSSMTDYYRGIAIDGWDGSDIFMPQGTLSLILTEKVYKILRKEKLNHSHYTDTEKYEITTYTIIKR